jgi:HTH-like domain
MEVFHPGKPYVAALDLANTPGRRGPKPAASLPAVADLKRPLIDPSDSHLSIRRRCELLGLNRSSYYLSPAVESEENLRLIRLIDEQFLKTPFYGSRRMTASLERAGETVNLKRVQRLMALMGLDPRRGVIAGPSGDLQHQPGVPVHGTRVHRPPFEVHYNRATL